MSFRNNPKSIFPEFVFCVFNSTLQSQNSNRGTPTPSPPLAWTCWLAGARRPRRPGTDHRWEFDKRRLFDQTATVSVSASVSPSSLSVFHAPRHTHTHTRTHARTHARTHPRTHALTHTHTHTQTGPSPSCVCTQPTRRWRRPTRSATWPAFVDGGALDGGQKLLPDMRNILRTCKAKFSAAEEKAC